jgi:hypothetical protein
MEGFIMMLLVLRLDATVIRVAYVNFEKWLYMRDYIRQFCEADAVTQSG